MATKSKVSLLSMTGFGKARVNASGVWVEVEVRSINHKFLDLSFKLPRGYLQFEQELRTLVGDKIERGRVEVVVSRGESAGGKSGKVSFNKDLFEAYRKTYISNLPASGRKNPEIEARMILDILSRKDVLTSDEDEQDLRSEQKTVRQALELALKALHEMRRYEGEKLGKDISARLDNVISIRKDVESATSRQAQTMRDKLVARIKKLSSEAALDENRLATEVVYLSDRADVTEEIVRLGSHIKQFEDALSKPPNGRRLDFIVQEISREINTIGSKAQEASVQSLVVDAKVELEKIREQLQNLA